MLGDLSPEVLHCVATGERRQIEGTLSTRPPVEKEGRDDGWGGGGGGGGEVEGGKGGGQVPGDGVVGDRVCVPTISKLLAIQTVE